jgi:hypothetical protein
MRLSTAGRLPFGPLPSSTCVPMFHRGAMTSHSNTGPRSSARGWSLPRSPSLASVVRSRSSGSGPTVGSRAGTQLELGCGYPSVHAMVRGHVRGREVSSGTEAVFRIHPGETVDSSPLALPVPQVHRLRAFSCCLSGGVEELLSSHGKASTNSSLQRRISKVMGSGNSIGATKVGGVMSVDQPGPDWAR